MSSLIHIASREIGTREIPGPQHNQKIVNYAKEAGFSYVNDDETPWCSFFMNWVAKKAKVESSDLGNARSWLNVGIPVVNPEPGDVVIFWRESPESYKGHVGVFMGYSQDHTRIYTLGGNQNNQVGETAYASSQLLGFRRLRPLKNKKISTKVLRRGDTGIEVVELQDALKLCGCQPGTSDGIFGPKTEAALKIFQSTVGVAINGVFNKATQKEMIKQLSKI
ncbi:TIGR02594 family protein [uncultured Psychroserpens sp.]|uniref:C40 family peptidase n=1 Tax=uncultured Psychroserpens sp. TaxID=255436 RepID=UPI002612BE54|nr:TIGR02594 family protein [uncultured Psychroserpens sp.]